MLGDKDLKLQTIDKIIALMDSLKAQSMVKKPAEVGDKSATMVAIEAKPEGKEDEEMPMHEASESPDVEAKEDATGEEDEDELLKKLAAQYAGIK